MLNQDSSDSNALMASPCPATTYCMAAETCCGFHSHRVLPWRAHRFRFGSSRLIRVKAAARVNLEIMHDSLWLSLGFHNRVHGMASHVGREQIPAAITTYLLKAGHTASPRVWSR